jgi:hypothetical protein
MSKLSKDATTASNKVNLTNLTGSLTTSQEKVAVAEITSKCIEMSM